jgi:hypothetical protein
LRSAQVHHAFRQRGCGHQHRIRPEDHGWIIYRIWSTDWFQRPLEQLTKVGEAIERARIVVSEMDVELPASRFEVNSESDDGLDRKTILELDNRGLTRLSEPYCEAVFFVPTNGDPHELYTQHMAAIVLRIVNPFYSEPDGPIIAVSY